MDLEPCFKVRNLVVQLNSTRLGHMTNLKVIFHMVVSIYKLDTICNSTHSFAQPRSGCNKRISNLVVFVKRFYSSTTYWYESFHFYCILAYNSSNSNS